MYEKQFKSAKHPLKKTVSIWKVIFPFFCIAVPKNINRILFIKLYIMMLYLVNSWGSQGLSVIYYYEGIFNIQSPQSISSYYLGSIPIMCTEKDKKK
jgi:hypothetical protein